ncbi:hypothetical protein ACFSCW_05395 [Sphingomonas tabacisoli]|uniref:Uncharacterized protein n=1 Tax=Sphingomonas tabacisoli TaxID=2249466 RepID=A0ABW4I006_9SPHN
MANVPAANPGPHPRAANDADVQPPGPSAFQRELDRARRHLARLEAEDSLRRAPLTAEDDARFDESPALVRVCNVLIWAIVLLPVLLAVAALVRRLAG